MEIPPPLHPLLLQKFISIKLISVMDEVECIRNMKKSSCIPDILWRSTG